MKHLNNIKSERNIKNVHLIYLGFIGAAGLTSIYLIMLLGLLSSNKGFDLYIIAANIFFLILSSIGVYNTFILARTNPTPIKFFINKFKKDINYKK